MDYAAWVSQQAFELEEAFRKADQHKMSKLISNLEKRKHREGVRIIGPDGRAAHNERESQEFLREFFATLFEGEARAFEELIEQDRAARSRHAFEQSLPEIDPMLIPSLFDLALGFAHKQLRKAFGEDLIAGEPLRVYANDLAFLYLPIALKTYGLLDIPMLHKGGQLYALFKEKGSPNYAASYRDILLSSDVGKTIQQASRGALVQDSQNNSVQTQYGSGLNHGTTTNTHLYVKSLVDIAEKQKVSISLIFADVKTAFASMLRETAFPRGYDAESKAVYIKRLVSLGFTQVEARSTYKEILEKYGTMEDDRAKTHLDSYLSMLHNFSWFSFEGLPGVTRSKSGTLAGTSGADLVFVRAVTFALKNIRVYRLT